MPALGEGLVPLLWLRGPSGVGKSSVAWAIYSDLQRRGITSALLELDQIGMCFPAPANDPTNDRLPVRNLGEIWPVFRATGVRALIVTGNVTSRPGLAAFAGSVPGTALTTCWLRAGRDDLRSRYDARGLAANLLDPRLRDADSLDDADLADIRVETDGLSVAETARRVCQVTGWSPGPPRPQATPASAPPAADRGRIDVPLLLLCGPRGVGTSSVGYAMAARLWRAGVRTGFVDLEQLGYCGRVDPLGPDNAPTKAAGLGRVWRGFLDGAAGCVIACARVDDPATLRSYLDAVPGARTTVCRLDASAERLTERILRGARAQGLGPPNPLKGRSPQDLRRIAAESARAVTRLARAAVGDLWIDTDDRSVEAVANEVSNRLDTWPAPGSPRATGAATWT